MGGPANPYIGVVEPAAQLPGGQGGRPPRCRATGPRDLPAIFFSFFCVQVPVARQPGGRGLSAKKRRQKIADRSLGPVAQLRAERPPLAARLLGDQLSHPYIRVGWSPTPHLHHYNSRNQEKREREGERRSPAGFSSRRLQVIKILVRFTNSMIVCPDMSSNYFCCNYFC